MTSLEPEQLRASPFLLPPGSSEDWDSLLALAAISGSPCSPPCGTGPACWGPSPFAGSPSQRVQRPLLPLDSQAEASQQNQASELGCNPAPSPQTSWVWGLWIPSHLPCSWARAVGYCSLCPFAPIPVWWRQLHLNTANLSYTMKTFPQASSGS